MGWSEKRGWSEDHGRQRRTSETRDLQAQKEAGKLFQLTYRVLLVSLQLQRMGLLLGCQLLPMGLLLGHLLGPQLGQLGLQYYTRDV